MRSAPHITVAPNGARLQKADHPAVPLTPQELAQTARLCHDAGARRIHLHVRDASGAHSLDVGLYRAAISAVKRAVPALEIQVTTEAAGRYQVAEQWALLRGLKPQSASIAVREIARAPTPELGAMIYKTALGLNIQVQHILYDETCLDRLIAWRLRGDVGQSQNDVLLVLGQYAPPRAARPGELAAFVARARLAGLQTTVCAFGPQEQACLVEAAHLGCALRVGFENNITAPDGAIWADNARAVASLRAACAAQDLRDKVCAP